MLKNLLRIRVGHYRSMGLLENFQNVQRKPGIFKRFKYVQNMGVKGIKGRNFKNAIAATGAGLLSNQEDLDFDDIEYDQLANSAMNITKSARTEQNILIIQPYIKWGAKKGPVKPDMLLQEAQALVRSIPGWRVEESLKVPLESLEKKQLFGSGKIQEIKDIIQNKQQTKHPFSSVFISKGTLFSWQKQYLESEFQIPVLDRYSVVIQILRLHAISAEAKLQVAMAEIPYIWSQVKDPNQNPRHNQRIVLSDSQKELLRVRERKLKQELDAIRSQRMLLRNKRKQKDYPLIAVVGYTNAGKTSLIKALTGEKEIQPRDQLFATLDVTAHAGLLPCRLEVIYMDTVGFMSDIPTGLIECFVATLEDAMLADLIIHVQDLSHENHAEQRRHVEETLKSLGASLGISPEDKNFPDILNVGNKIDLVKSNGTSINDTELNLVSSKTFIGINDLLNAIEKNILKATNREKIIFRVKSGGHEAAWLYKNSAVSDAEADPDDAEQLLITTVITNSKLQQFRHHFVRNKN